MKIDQDKVSKAVRSNVKQVYARLASQAAKKAMQRIHYHDDIEGAERFAAATETWLLKAGAEATRWTFKLPDLIP